MQLVKVQDGLLELDNFLLTSEFSDFLGNGTFSRSLDTFILQKGEIERKINYDELVIVVEKEATALGYDDRFEFYLSDSGGDKKVGLEEIHNTEYVNFWKLIYFDGYAQGYKSLDGIVWDNVGGSRFNNKPTYQGFKAEGKELVIKDYKVYRSPYITVQNFYPDTLVRLLDIEGNLIKERKFTLDHECNIFLDYPGMFILEFYDPIGELVYKSNPLSLQYGDIFMFTEYNLQLFYKGQLLTHKTTTLYTLLETVIVKNNSQEAYNNINISINNKNTDDITISFDNISFTESLVITEIQPGEEIEIYIKIVKDKSKLFKMNEFTLEIS